MDAVTPVFRNRNEIARSLALVMLMIVMDMSGLAGLAAQDELDERQDKWETLSGINMPGFQAGLVSSSTTLSLQQDGYGGCVVLDDGTLWCWGSDNNNALGNGNSVDSTSTPEIILGPLGSGAPTQTNQATDIVVSVSLGVKHNCALIDTGNSVPGSSELWCWGSYFPNGVYNQPNQEAPSQVNNLGGDATLVDSGDPTPVPSSTTAACSVGGKMALVN